MLDLCIGAVQCKCVPGACDDGDPKVWLQSSYTSEDGVTVLPLSFSNTMDLVLKLLFLGTAK